MSGGDLKFGDIESFVTRTVLSELRERRAPQLLIDAFVPLLDDAVAERAYQVIYDCKRK